MPPGVRLVVVQIAVRLPFFFQPTATEELRAAVLAFSRAC